MEEAILDQTNTLPMLYSLVLYTVIAFILEPNESKLLLDACNHAYNNYIIS
jgi:hypothetical protein